MSATVPVSRPGNAWRQILPIGLIAGTMDISAAFIQAYMVSGVSPLRVLRFVASGVFGTSALTGGTGTALWGLLFHYLIAMSWAALFFLLYPSIRKVSTNWILNGVVYGVVVWLLMNLIVVPLSNTPPRVIPWNLQTFISMGIIIVCIGLPIALLVKRSYARGNLSA